ncbi:uncharacterized protein EDB91DRAFT_1084143 [Suillus paluster]|uniref:uncharacterized protein n=1 Tax=Suillus paluster TaxID=48578 RepID=UPI001B863D5A|nr:uncharacterized protein EDB91DRAFT_1084143 [Suillus paluster]KAG1734240.1 hypothetical protein EDB91DRAFT_1084143 [Suillus paluster]
MLTAQRPQKKKIVCIWLTRLSLFFDVVCLEILSRWHSNNFTNIVLILTCHMTTNTQANLNGLSGHPIYSLGMDFPPPGHEQETSKFHLLSNQKARLKSCAPSTRFSYSTVKLSLFLWAGTLTSPGLRTLRARDTEHSSGRVLIACRKYHDKYFAFRKARHFTIPDYSADHLDRDQMTLVNDVWMKIIQFLDIMDIVRCFAVSSLFSMLGHEVINSRLNYVLEHAVSSRSDQLRAMLDCTKSVLLGSSALDIILYGTSSIIRHELRIATPHYAKGHFAAFFDGLGFTTDQFPTLYTPPSVVAVYDYDYIQNDSRKVTLINSPTDSVMPVILAHRSSTNCIFVASGGLFLGYPKLMNSHVTLLPLSHPRSSTVREFCNREYEVQTHNCWTLPCRKRCPTLWHCMDDGLAVTWHNGVIPLHVTDGQNLQWRLSSHCTNYLCRSNIFRDPDPYSGACSDDSVDHRVAKLKSRNAVLPYVTGLLFGAAMMHPYVVPLYLDNGRTHIASINDLNVRPFIRKRGIEPDNIIDCGITRQTIMMDDCAFMLI